MNVLVVIPVVEALPKMTPLGLNCADVRPMSQEHSWANDWCGGPILFRKRSKAQIARVHVTKKGAGEAWQQAANHLALAISSGKICSILVPSVSEPWLWPSASERPLHLFQLTGRSAGFKRDRLKCHVAVKIGRLSYWSRAWDSCWRPVCCCFRLSV